MDLKSAGYWFKFRRTNVKESMTPPKKTKKVVKSGPDFGRNNYLILGIGLLFIIAGFLFLGFGDITIAPILLVLGYCVLIPLGILFPRKKEKQVEPEPGKAGSAG
jgi:hypothetical protein